MRQGENTSKDKLLQVKPCEHRVIIPLYIPKEEDYYQDAFEIFEMCIKSVLKTAQSPLKVSVISDASCKSVNDKLLAFQKDGLIDELIIVGENIGKINSILKALRTAQERLITITDADVLFVNGWEQEVISIFKAFPKAGVVCPVPVFRTHFKLTSNIWIRHLFSKRLKFLPVKNEEALARFANSIGWPWLDTKWKDTIATLEAKNGQIAVVGSSHFVATYKREVFNKLPEENSSYKLGGDSEYRYTDLPALKMDAYRLSTYDNYAYHMGNMIENWMLEEFGSLKVAQKEFNTFDNLNRLKSSYFSYVISKKVFAKLLHIKIFKKILLRNKGLNTEQIENFMT